MPEDERRVTIRISVEEHEMWRISAEHEDLSLNEWVRRAGNQHAVEGPYGGDFPKRAREQIGEVIVTLQDMLKVVSRKELGWVTGPLLCLGHYCHELGLGEHLPL